MTLKPDWIDDCALAISKRVLQGSGDRSDLHRIQSILEEFCPFERGVLYEKVELGAEAVEGEVCQTTTPVEVQMLPDTGITVQTGKTFITLLPAISGHCHSLGVDGHPKCGCQFLKPASVEAKVLSTLPASGAR